MKWTEEKKNEAIKLIDSGVSFAETARLMKTSKNSIHIMYIRVKHQRKIERIGRINLPYIRDMICVLFIDGFGIDEIAKETIFTVDEVANCIKECKQDGMYNDALVRSIDLKRGI